MKNYFGEGAKIQNGENERLLKSMHTGMFFFERNDMVTGFDGCMGERIFGMEHNLRRGNNSQGSIFGFF